jgi:hypothetical protein
MDEAVTSRTACCCRYGASDNFGLADFGFRWAAAYSPQKIPEIRFRDVLAQAARKTIRLLRGAGISSTIHCIFHD